MAAEPARQAAAPVSSGHIGFVAGLLGFLEDTPAPAAPHAPAAADAPEVAATPAPAEAVAAAPTPPPPPPPTPVQFADPDAATERDAPDVVEEPVYDWTATEAGPALSPEQAALASAPPIPDHDLVLELTSFDPQRRRDGLRGLMLEELRPEAAAAAAVALQDPERDIRHLALQLFERSPAMVPLDSLRAVAFDTDAAVRTRAIALAGRLQEPALLFDLGERLLTESEEAVLEATLTAITTVVRTTTVTGDQLDAIYRAIGQVGLGHLGILRPGLHTLAANLAPPDLLHRLGHPDDDLRAGAAVLAFESGGDTAMHAVARLTSDHHPIVRRYANAAVAASRTKATADTPATTDHRRGTALPEPRGDARRGTRPAVDEVEQAMLPSLVEALGDPKADVRDEAAEALAGMDREKVIAWIWTQSRSADGGFLECLLDAARRLDATEIGEPLARAVLRVRAADAQISLVATARGFAALSTVADRWRQADHPNERIQAAQLLGVLSATDPEPVLALFRDPNAEVRLAAIEAATTIGVDDRVAEVLLDLVERDSSIRVRMAAVAAHATCTATERVTAVRAALSTPFAEVRRASLDLLAGEGDAEFDLLTTALADQDGDVAQRAASILMDHPRPETLAVLWTQLRGSTGASRQRLLEVLRNLDAVSVRRLAMQAAGHPDPSERIVGIAAMAALGDERELSRLIEALQDPTPAVRLEALNALGSHPGLVALGPVTASLRDPEPTVRACTVRVLAALEDDGALPQIVGALDDPSPLVREAVVEVLDRRRSPEVAELLLGHLDRPAHQTTVAQLLARMGPSATEALLARLPEADATQRLVLLQALRAAGITDRLVAELRAPAPAVRRRALELLGLLHHVDAADAIADRLSDPDPQMRSLAATILGELGDERAIDRLREAFGSDPDMDVVAAVERAFRQLATDE